MDDDLKLGSFTVEGVSHEFLSSIRTLEIKPAATSFQVNMGRVGWSSLIFDHFTQCGIRWGVAHIAANLHCYDNPFPSIRQAPALEHEKYRRDLLKGEIYLPYRNMAIGRDLLLEAFADDLVTPQLRSLYSSAIISTWTAFEILAGDLWVAVVNRFPLLGVRALKAEPLPNDNETDADQKSKKTFPIPVQRLLDPAFDLQNSMGDLLSDTFPMTKWKGMLDAYKAIFGEQAIIEILRDKDLRFLSAVRNVLVHKAGIADRDFIQQVKSDLRFSHIQVGQEIKLDGQLTSNLIEAGRTQAIKLIEYADNWCTKQLSNR